MLAAYSSSSSERFFIHMRGEMGHVRSTRKENQMNSAGNTCAQKSALLLSLDYGEICLY
jgi:hypothetical protein